MKNNICPKCGKQEIYYKQNSGSETIHNIPITGFSYGAISYYVCINCGYMEFYLERQKDLDKIAKKWKQIF